MKNMSGRNWRQDRELWRTILEGPPRTIMPDEEEEEEEEEEDDDDDDDSIAWP
jgi:hypothetical protein